MVFVVVVCFSGGDGEDVGKRKGDTQDGPPTML